MKLGGMSSLGTNLLELVYPTRCALCGALGPVPCAACESQFEKHDVGVQYFDDGPLAYRGSVFLYRGVAAEAVQALKYRRATSLARWMSRQIADFVDAHDLEYDVVVPVPIHWSRRAQRGFNQAEMLAESLGGRFELLARTKRTKPQVGLTREARLTNLAGAFEASRAVRGHYVLLIDDVLTSGGTATECARCLLGAGASAVGILTFAGEPFS